MESFEAGVRTLERRLALPLGEKGTGRTPGGYRSRTEWFHKSRRLGMLKDRLAAVRADRDTGTVHVVRGGRRLLNGRHYLDKAGLPVEGWQERWEAGRSFLQADGESGKKLGNETIRVTPEGEVSIRLPTPLAALTNAAHGRYVLSAQAAFAHRGADVAVDPAYTSKWGAQHWRQPMTAPHREVSRHDAASIAVGRRALGHPIRRRTAPPPHDRSDRAGHRTVQTEPETPGREEPRHPGPEHAHDARPRTGPRTRATSASNTVRDAHRTRRWVQNPLLDTVQER
ncbi:hypothetical protein [Actinomadura sp. CNU-125]|uniref:hypothetical protein n=1 Tax=Actinomadura sp. CNU-125 TaxID=1904961 RepID=UPI0021CCEA66|nr:hypothetical protein [Actinomadura sp. CNU-125]